MKKVLFTFFALLCALHLAYGQSVSYGSVQVQATSVPSQLKGCKSEILRLQFTNTDQNNPYNNFDLFFSSATTHVVFEDFQNTNVINDAVGNKLTIQTLLPGQVFVIDIPVRRNCDQTLLQNLPPASMSLKLGTHSTDDFVFSFNVVTNGLLSFKNTLSTNLIYTGHRGDVNQNRSFVFENNNLEFNGSLYFKDNLSDNIQLNSISLKIGNSVVALPFTIQTIASQKIIELDIDLLAINPGTRIEIIENFDVIGCPVSSSTVILKWGCKNDYCNDFDLDPSTHETVQSVEIKKGPEIPLLTAETSGVFPDACVDGGPRHMKCVFKNTSGAPAFDVKIDFALNSYGSPRPMNLARNFKITSFSNSIVMDGITDPQLQGYLAANGINNYTNGSVSLNQPILMWTYTLADRENSYAPDKPLYKTIPGQIDNSTNDIFNQMIMFLKSFPVGAEIIFEWDEYDVCVQNLVSGLAYGEYQLNGNYAFYFDECGVKQYFATSKVGYSGIGLGFISPTLSSNKQSAANNMFGCTTCGTGTCFGGCPTATTTTCGGDRLNNGSDLSTCDFTETIEVQNYNLGISEGGIYTFPINGNNYRIAVEILTEGNLLPAPGSHLSRGDGNIKIVSNQNSYTGISTITTVNSASDVVVDGYTLAGPVAGVKSYFDFPASMFLNAQGQFSNQLLSNFMNSTSVFFDLSAICGRYLGSCSQPAAKPRYLMKIYLVPDNSSACTNGCEITLGEYQSDMLVNCPGCKVPGVITTNVEVVRTTVGLNDGDNDGFPDAINASAQFQNLNSKAKLNNVTQGDNFEMKTRSLFWSGGEVTYEAMQQNPQFGPDFLDNYYRIDNIGSVGIIATNSIPLVDFKLFRSGVDPQTGTPAVNLQLNFTDVFVESSSGSHMYKVSRNLIRSKTGDPNFVFLSNDAVYMTVNYQVAYGWNLGEGKYYNSNDVNASCYLSGGDNRSLSGSASSNEGALDYLALSNYLCDDGAGTSTTTTTCPGAAGPVGPPPHRAGCITDRNPDGSLKGHMDNMSGEDVYLCEAYGTGLILADFKTLVTITGSDGNCDKELTSYVVNSGDNAYRYKTNLFPYEIRNIGRADYIDIVIPSDYVLDINRSIIAINSQVRDANNIQAFGFDSYIVENQTLNANNYQDLGAVANGRNYRFFFHFKNSTNSIDNFYKINDVTFSSGQYRKDLTSTDLFTLSDEYSTQYIDVRMNPKCSTVLHDKVWIGNTTLTPDGNSIVVKAPDVSYQENLNSNTVHTLVIPSSGQYIAEYKKPFGNLTYISVDPATLYVSERDQSFTFKLKSDNDIHNVFNYFTTTIGRFHVTSLLLNGQPILMTNGLYALGDFATGEEKTIQIKGNYDCLDGSTQNDKLTIHYGWACEGYPTITNGQPNTAVCNQGTSDVFINTSPVAVRVETDTDPVNCDQFKLRYRYFSDGNGSIYDGIVNATLPAGLSVIGYQLKYLPTATIIAVNATDVVQSGNVITFNLASYMNSYNINSGQAFEIEFTLKPSCLFVGGNVGFNLMYNNYCGKADSKNSSFALPFSGSCNTYSVNLSGGDPICAGASGTINAQVTGGPLGVLQYTWYSTVNGVRTQVQGPDQTNTYQYNNILTTTTFEVIVNTTDGLCATTKNKQVIVYSLPNLTLTAVDEFCIGSAPTVLKGQPSGGTFTGTGITLTSGIYTFNATTAGNYIVNYNYTDPTTGCIASKSHTIVVAACCKYALASTEVMCGEDAIRCITLKAVKAVDDGIKGMDFILRYDRTLMRPTGIPGRGNATLGNVVLNGGMTSGMGSYAMTERTITGTSFNELSVSIFYTGQAPAVADFDGTGDVICIEFKILGTGTVNLAGTTKSIYIGDFYQGAFSQGVVDDEHKLFMIRSCVENNGTGIISILKNNLLNGKVYYHNDVNAPLRYDASTTPKPYLVTTITPVTTGAASTLCLPSSVASTTTDINGAYVIDLTGANGVKVSRDIVGDYYNSCTNPSDVIDQTGNVYNPANLLVAINGYDAYLMESITTMRAPVDVVYVADRKVPGVNSAATATTSFPTAFQMIASDVNMDRMVRAADISLVQERAVSKLCEYPQVWNYTQGVDPSVYPANTTDQRSLDWRFVDKVQAANSIAYKKSGSYPLPAGIVGQGAAYYWRDNVPYPTFCLAAPAANPLTCKSYANSFDIYAIMLGDIDGSWRANLNGAQKNLRTVSDRQVVINTVYKQRRGINTYRVPVTFVSQDPATVSLDFALDYNEDELSVIGVGNLEGGDLAGSAVVYNDFENKQLLFTSYTMTGFNSSKSIYYIDFVSKNGDFNANMLGNGDAYLNGEKVELVVEGSTITGIDNPLSGSQYGFEVIPNPAANEGEILYNIKAGTRAKIVVYNTLGQIITEYKDLQGQGSIQVATSDWSSGMYQVILFTENSQKLIKKWVIQN